MCVSPYFIPSRTIPDADDVLLGDPENRLQRVKKSITEMLHEALRGRPLESMMAHMDRISMGGIYGV